MSSAQRFEFKKKHKSCNFRERGREREREIFIIFFSCQYGLKVIHIYSIDISNHICVEREERISNSRSIRENVKNVILKLQRERERDFHFFFLLSIPFESHTYIYSIDISNHICERGENIEFEVDTLKRKKRNE